MLTELVKTLTNTVKRLAMGIEEFKSDTDLRLDDVVICMGRRRDSPTCLMTPGQDSPTVSLTEVVSGDNNGITIH